MNRDRELLNSTLEYLQEQSHNNEEFIDALKYIGFNEEEIEKEKKAFLLKKLPHRIQLDGDVLDEYIDFYDLTVNISEYLYDKYGFEPNIIDYKMSLDINIEGWQ